MADFRVVMLDGEYWYGLGGLIGTVMPLGGSSRYEHDFRKTFLGNQEAPFIVSNMGRYIWSEHPFYIKVAESSVYVEGAEDLALHEGFSDLRGAYLDACEKYFKPNGKLPAENFFKKPQYNTWAELIYDQNQRDVLKYAHGIIENGLPAGIIMIDDNWNCRYGTWEFNRETFPDPKAMLDELHSLGFEVMLWVCPFISPDSEVFRALKDKGCLVKAADGQIAVRYWWNGFSAVLDLTNPEAVKWFTAQTDRLTADYGIDGYKFDAGDVEFYRDDDITYEKTDAHGQCEAWARLGLNYAYNEYRACFKCAGLPLVQRLCDKAHRWDGGLDMLIPDTLTQGILGYSYTCPDMIGGGSYPDFLPGAPNLDPELFVRSAQCSALLPMMQYSAAPWRVLDAYHAALCVKAGELHLKFSEKLFGLVKNASTTGEPVIRYMEYVYPHSGYAKITDQFMVGDDLLCAPVVTKGQTRRVVTLPAGKWTYCDGTVYEGGQTVTVPAPLECLPYFLKN